MTVWASLHPPVSSTFVDFHSYTVDPWEAVGGEVIDLEKGSIGVAAKPSQKWENVTRELTAPF